MAMTLVLDELVAHIRSIWKNTTISPQGRKGAFSHFFPKSQNRFKINFQDDLEGMTFIKLSEKKMCLIASLFTLLDSEARFAEENLSRLSPEEKGHHHKS